MLAFDQRIRQENQKRRELGLERQVTAKAHGNSAFIELEGKRFNNFSSNDYLGLASDKDLVRAWQQNLELYGSGSAASPLVVGQSFAHAVLQDALCDWLDYPRAILFNSGFSANQAVLFALLQKTDTLIQDKLNHASLMEAGILCGANMKRFTHNDMGQLERLLQSNTNNLVVTEGVFSMDGDTSPLAKIHELCNEHDAWLMLDDAHGIGVIGDEGRGSAYTAGVKPELLVVTFGKAIGISGAAVMCSEETADYLTQFARHYVYSTAMPPAQAATLTQAICKVRKEQWRRDKLVELQYCYQQQMSHLAGYVETQTPIKPLIIGSSGDALYVAKSLQASGHWVSAIRPPTVPANTARLRITLSASHSLEQVKALGESLKSLLGSKEAV
ncbi:8-amino-7-oxononanoate synthase [Vibrio ishigakensis]|uniref:8-amino-7-ketopelargonate synthase n=1 Tax=Vibrio ishigakensis TaxID=1481914 RepID=A0A0B8Q9E3_9VIBR|nr:8-amino-7-oxononanoate synthase [Vibrio ishigakensis]